MIVNSLFKPAWGLAAPHIQTLLPTFLRLKLNIDYQQQTLELDDGDFLDLAWTEKPDNNKPVIVVFHGLEGSINSPYAKGIMIALKKQGWIGLLMHFRGCSGRPNRLPRSYHSGETGDAKILLKWLKDNHPDTPLAAIGFSLGGNMLLKLQGELGKDSPFKAAVSVCAPLMLKNCALRLDHGFSKLYQRHLIKRMKRSLLEKFSKFDFKKLIKLDNDGIYQLENFWQFDDQVTAPLHGFSGAEDYYAKSSARQYLKDIRRSTLIIQALDDPFMTSDVIPDESELSESVQLELSNHGGHIGFLNGHFFKPSFWLEQRIPEFLSEVFLTNR
jgi:uncharacterized protein